MSRKVSPLLPSTVDGLRQFGTSLRIARLRRGLTAKQVAERAGMAPITLRHVERGADGVTIGAYLATMQVLGLEKEFLALAKTDAFGRELQDAKLLGSRGTTRRKGTMPPTRDPAVGSDGDPKPGTADQSSSAAAFTTVEDLAALIAPTRRTES